MVLATTARIVIGDDSIQGVTQVKLANPATWSTLLIYRVKGAVVIRNDKNRARTPDGSTQDDPGDHCRNNHMQ